MSWSLKRQNVALRVARFLPEVAPAQESKPVAGLSPLARALWRDRRAKEQRKVAPAVELS
jgi:hypothetical protein